MVRSPLVRAAVAAVAVAGVVGAAAGPAGAAGADAAGRRPPGLHRQVLLRDADSPVQLLFATIEEAVGLT